MSKIITGFHAIEERILSLKENQKSSKDFKIYYTKTGPRVKKILSEAKGFGVSVTQCDEKTLDTLVSKLDKTLRDHRGIVLEIFSETSSTSNIIDFDVWLQNLKTKSDDEKCTVVILDKITDPHNVGAILRSCDQFGVNLVVLPEKNSISDIGSEVIARSSAGASAWIPISVVINLSRAAEKLQDAGFWVYAADMGGENCRTVNFSKKSVLVLGSEGNGISRLLQEKCDTIISIPTCGKIDSLNVSVAAGVLLYEMSK